MNKPTSKTPKNSKVPTSLSRGQRSHIKVKISQNPKRKGQYGQNKLILILTQIKNERGKG